MDSGAISSKRADELTRGAIGRWLRFRGTSGSEQLISPGRFYEFAERLGSLAKTEMFAAEAMAIHSTSYHPMRYGRTRPFAKPFVAAYLARVARRSATPAEQEELSRMISGIYGRTLHQLGSQASATPMLHRAVELDLALAFSRFTAHGRNIFSVTPELVDLLQSTSLDGVQLQDLVLPFDSFYVGFAEPLALALPGVLNRIDGAYVEATPEGGILIRITSRRLDVPSKARGTWVSHPEPVYTVYLNGEPHESLEAMLDQSVGKMTEAMVHWGVDAFHENDFPDSGEDPVESAWVANFALINGKDVAAQVLAIIVNTLCYLASEPGLAELRDPARLPDDAPEHLARATGRGRASHREAAAARLADGGYLPVRIVGRSIRPINRTPALSTGRTVSPHWRRGHPRRQRFGPGRQQLRIIRVSPVLVRGDLGEPQCGRVYDVR